MENKDLIDKVEKNFDKCIFIIDKSFPSHKDKIEFLKLCNEDFRFIDHNKHHHDIKEAINLLVENAREDMSRKHQQQKLMPIINLISTEDDIKKIDAYFQKEKNLFSLYCLMHLSFLYEESLNEHVNKHHVYIMKALEKSSKDLIKFNLKIGEKNEKNY